MKPLTTNSLKSLSIHRIQNDMIKTILSQNNNTPTLLILDDTTAKILNSFLSITSLINCNIFSIERLLTKRQPFPKYDAIYFITPSIESCNQISTDFNNPRKPMYNRVHIYFSHKIDDTTFDILVNRILVPRVSHCKELNLDYYIRDSNLFDFNMNNYNFQLFSNKTPPDVYNKILTSYCDKLLTICAVCDIYPNIQYQKQSKHCFKIAEMLNNNLKSLFRSKERKGILLLTDRSIDPTSPLMHDYNYETMVYDLLTFTHQNELNYNNLKSKLDDNDELWQVYKDLHLVQVFETISEDFNTFMNSDLAKVGKTNLNTFNDMEHCLKNLTGYKQKNIQFSLHLKIAEEINKKFKSQQLAKIIDLEQDIISGIDEYGASINEKNIMKKFTLLKKELEQLNQITDIMRLLAIMVNCLDINEKDFDALAGTASKDLFYNFTALGVDVLSSTVTKCKRKGNKIEKAVIKQMKQKLSQIEYKVLRSEPKIANVVEMCAKYCLNKSEFAFIEEPKNLIAVQRYGRRNIFNKGNIISNSDIDEDKPLLILFNVGGIAHNEISAVNNLEKEGKINYKVIIGSTGIYNAEQYMKEITNLNKEYEEYRTSVIQVKEQPVITKEMLKKYSNDSKFINMSSSHNKSKYGMSFEKKEKSISIEEFLSDTNSSNASSHDRMKGSDIEMSIIGSGN